MTLRTVRAQPGRGPEVAALSIQATSRLNERLGTQFSVSVQVGGNPDLVAAAARWESMADYEAARQALAADEEVQDLIAQGGALSIEVTDQIVQVVKPPGERAAFATVNQAQMVMPKVAEAIPFALEICEFVEAKVGTEVGVVAAFTGARNQLAWVGNYDSLDQIGTQFQTLETDPEYLDFFKRSADMFVDGSLEAAIWQRIS